MRFNSITAKVTIWFTVMMAIIVALVIVFMAVVGRGAAAENAESLLIRTVQGNVGEVDYDDGIFDLDEIRFYQHNVYIMVYSENKKLIGGAGLSDFPGSDEFLNGETRHVEVDGEDCLVYDVFVPHNEGSVWLRGVTSSANTNSAVRVIVILSIIIFPVMVIFSAVGGWLIARMGFKPIRQMIKTVDAINDGNDLSARIGLRRGIDEIHMLAATFDRLLARLEASFENEKRFVSDASHELRTPTAVIIAECELARKENSSVEEYRDSILVIERQAKRLSTLNNKLLAMTRLDQSTNKLSTENANFSELTSIVCSEISSLNQKNIRLHTNIEEGIFAAFDVSLMARLVQNLVENAYKYSNDGDEITVTLVRDGSNLLLKVSDTGIGMTAAQLTHIWERFWQADPSRSDNEQGSGLGLAMVKQIANMHGGVLSVSSKFGTGSEFTYSMPCLAPDFIS